MKVTKVALLVLFALFASSAGATLILFQWDPGGTYPGGTTYDLSVNATDVTGIATNSYSLDLVSGTSILVRVRAVPPAGQGTASTETTANGTVPYKSPSSPTGFQLIKFKVVVP